MAGRVSSIKAMIALMITVVMIATISGVALCQEDVKVVEVAVSGNQNINSQTILNVITLKQGDVYSGQTVEKDKAAITALGYFSAVTVHRTDADGGIKITYEVTENPRITDIKVIGSEPVPASEVVNVMKTKVGQVLNTATLDQDIEAMQSLYMDKGYYGYVTEDIDIDAATGVLTIPIMVNKIESIDITGNKKTREYVFLREMKTKPGMVYNVKTLKEDLIKIYNLDILEDIKPFQTTPGSSPGLIKIGIPVVEKKTGQVSLAFGYSSKSRLVGQVRLSENNFKGTGRGLNLMVEQGTTDAVGGPTSYELGFLEPWLDDKHTSLSASVYSRVLYRFSSGVFNSDTLDDNDEPYNERHKGGDLTLSRPLTEKTRVYLGGRYENVETDIALLDDPDLVGLVQTGDVLTGSLRLVHNSRDFDLDPGFGGYEGVNLELGHVDGQKYNANLTTSPIKGVFEKGSVDLRRYFSKGGRKDTPQDKRTTIAVRLRAGISGGELPFFEQFFVGGGESLRGYEEDRFWGEKMFVMSLEFRKPIAQSITGVLFADYGDAWGGSSSYDQPEFPQSQSFEGHLGVGVGMRVTTPIGHLRLDYGVGDDGGRTHFSMGHAF